jgi:hypothetical protein
MKAKITTDEASLQAQQKTIDSDKARLENLKDSSDYADYNNGVPSFNSEVDTYNTMVTVTRSLIAQYNQLVEARNAIAIEENQLVQDISSAPQQIPQ